MIPSAMFFYIPLIRCVSELLDLGYSFFMTFTVRERCRQKSINDQIGKTGPQDARSHA